MCNIQRNHSITLSQLDLRNEQTIFINLNRGAEGGARSRSDKEEMVASSSEEEKKEQNVHAEDVQEVPCVVRTKGGRGHKRKRGRKQAAPLDITTGNRARKRRKKYNAQRDPHKVDWNSDIWMQKMFRPPKATGRYQCRMGNGLEDVDESANA